jgi:hypothetical protein
MILYDQNLFSLHMHGSRPDDIIYIKIFEISVFKKKQRKDIHTNFRILH